MKTISETIKRIISRASLVACMAAVLASCDSIIYDEEGDCNPYYKVRFVYDWNMKGADAFPNEVLSVTLYAFDADGNIVWSKHESGDALRSDDYLMDVELAPGTYSFVAWCGEGHRSSFTVADAQKHTGLTCTLGRDYDDDGSAHSRNSLQRLYHGKLENQELSSSQGVHIYKMPLIKDTNTVRVVLQHLSGEPVNPDDFHFSITDTNGSMAWDNSLLDDEQITYHAWDVAVGSAGVYLPEDNDVVGSRAVTSMSATVAEMTVARLVKDQDCRLYVHNTTEGRVVASIPLIDYALMVKGFENKNMEDQEYLDRQDEYNLVFFLDEAGRWVNASIYINSYKVVLQDVEI